MMRKNGTIRFRRCGQYKGGTDRTQFAALLDAPAADHLLLRIGVAVSVDEVHRIQKTGVNLTPDRSATRLCRSSTIPVTIPYRLETVSGRVLVPLPFSSKPLPEWDTADTVALPVTAHLFVLLITEKKRSPPTSRESISPEPPRWPTAPARVHSFNVSCRISCISSPPVQTLR